MGYVIPERRVTLVVDEGFYEGASFEASLSIGLGDYFRVIRLLEAVESAETADDVERLVREAGEIFVTRGLRSWTLLDPVSNEPVPVSLDGLMALPLDLIANLMGLWTSWIGKAPPPLAPRSESSPSTESSSTEASPPKRSTRRKRAA